MPAKRAYAGIDLGTSSVKVVVVDDVGNVLGAGQADHPVQRPHPGFAEQEPDAWWRATALATQQALAAAGRPDIAAMGLTGQMHGAVLLDHHDLPLAPAIIWMDQRSGDQVGELTDGIGRQSLIEITGSPLATGFQAVTLKWLQRHEPGRWDQISRVLLPKDELRRRITGEIATDPSDASGTLLHDVRTRDWSETILGALGLSRDHLPTVQPSTASAGAVSAEAAAHLGIAAGIPVVTGAGDAPAAALGAGVVSGETLFLTLSTGAQVLVPRDHVVVDAAGRLHTFCATSEPDETGASWYQMGATLAAGFALRWLRDNIFGLGGEDGIERMTTWAADVPPGSNGLVVVPYLLGERTPHMDPSARGVIVGLTAVHGRGELVRATMEGVVFACREAFTALQENGATPGRIVVAGGGSRSSLWLQIIADVFGLPVQPLTTADQSTMGAAMLAAIGTGEIGFAEATARWPEYGEVVKPDGSAGDRYDDLMAVFRAAYEKHREDFRVLEAIAGR
ncbi:MAG: xylulokinase [Thermomicrobiales bacterium]